nr:MAG TPA: hypothetical protein [Caudoviricetes sp.]
MKKVTKLGSKWNNSANAGTFYWNLNNATSNRNRNISRQLVNARFSRGKFPGCFNDKSVFLKDRATWQNRQPPKGGS